MRVQTRKSGRVTDTSCRTRPFPIIRRTAKHRSPRIDSSRCCRASREAMPDWRSATIGKAARRVKPARQKGLGWRGRIGPNDGEEIPPRIVDELEIGERAAADDDEVGKRARRERSGACSGGRRRDGANELLVFQFGPEVGGNGMAEGGHVPFDLGARNRAGNDRGDDGMAERKLAPRWQAERDGARRRPRSSAPAPESRRRPGRNCTSRRERRPSREFRNCSRRLR